MLEYICKHYGPVIHIFDPIYGANIYAGAGCRFSAYRKKIKSLIDVDLSDGDFIGRFWEVEHVDGRDVGLIWSSNKGATLAHECFHATCYVMRRAGISLTEESEEAYAYYQSFLMKSVLGQI